MLKGHSAGIGDILRSSAAWRALKNAFPQSQLHLALFTPTPGMLRFPSFPPPFAARGGFVDKKLGFLQHWPRLSAWAAETAQKMKPDLVIDFEWAGLYSAFAAWRLGQTAGAVTAGIGEIPLRGMFYDVASVAKARFARPRGLEFPLEYTNRDFVCLSALGIERQGLPIELEETAEGRIFRESFRATIPNSRGGGQNVGVNIGCGTPDAAGKRPDLRLLRDVVQEAQGARQAVVVLTGASFERDVNQKFAGLWPARTEAVAL